MTKSQSAHLATLYGFFLQNSKCHEVTMFLKSRRIFSNTTLERMAEDSESCFGKTLCKSRS